MFPNAEVIVHEVEAAFWLDRTPHPDDSERIARGTKQQRAVTAPYRDRMRRIRGGEVLPGITAMLRPGHTPGHTNYLIQSGNDRLLLWGDIVHLAPVQMARPDARLVYDYDADLAAVSRGEGAGLGGERALHRRRRASRPLRASAGWCGTVERFAIEAV